MTTNDNTYPAFVTENSREEWDSFTAEQKQAYLDVVPYLQREYPDEELSVAMIGTALAFGA